MTNRYLKSQSIRHFSRTALLACLALSVSGCNWVTLLSVSSTGESADAPSELPSASVSGRYVAFRSLASNLVAGDTNGTWDVFVRDTLDGTTTRVSVDSAGAQASGGGVNPSISGDGRYVAFFSYATDLVAADTNGVGDVFVRDTLNGTTTRVSVDSAEVQGNNLSYGPSISGDGRYVAFYSSASNLVTGDLTSGNDIFVRDTLNGTTTLISVDSAGTQGNSDSFDPSISGDGRYVAFRSVATNLVVGDTNGTHDIFVRDTVAGTTTRVSVDSGEVQGNSSSFDPSISGDGRYVAFHTNASNLVGGDTNNTTDIFVRDTQNGTTTRVSVDSAGAQGNSFSYDPSLSSDGRYVAFRSNASNLVAGDTNNTFDVFVRDTQTGTTSRVSLDALGVEANSFSYNPSISADGRYVAFETEATNLVPDDLNGQRDIAIRAIPEVTVTSVIPDHLPIGATTSVTISGTNFLPGARPSLSGSKLTNVVIVDENTITMDVEVKANQTPVARTLGISLFGTGPGVIKGAAGYCANCVTYQ